MQKHKSSFIKKKNYFKTPVRLWKTTSLTSHNYMLIVTLKNAVAGICNQFCLETLGLFLQCAMGHYSFEM